MQLRRWRWVCLEQGCLSEFFPTQLVTKQPPNETPPPNANFPARNSRPVIAGFVRPTWERVPLKFPWINRGLGDFFEKNPDATWGVESSVRTLWAVRRTDLWMVGLIPWSAMRSRCHLRGWPTDSRDEPIPAHLTAKFTSWILILLGRRSFPFGCPAFFFFSAMWVLGRHGRASPWNMGSKVWPTKILKNSRMVRNPINYTSFKMWGYLDVHL